MNYNWGWAMFFKPTGIGSDIYQDWFVTGLGRTIAIALAAWVIALLLGSLLGVLRTAPSRWVAGIATTYVETFRNVPLLVQLFLWYFPAPDLLPEQLELWLKQDLNPATSAYLSVVVVCQGLFTAARVCEQARPKCQLGAAGVLQGSCRDSRVFYAAIFSVGCSLSGLSVTAPMGCQFRVLLDQRCGF